MPTADFECDILIAGAGAPGLCAALAARMHGLSPLLVDSRALLGTRASDDGGMLWLPANPVMRREHIRDTRDAAETYLANFADARERDRRLRRQGAFIDGVAALVALIEAQDIALLHCAGIPDCHDLLPGGHRLGRALQVAPVDLGWLGPWRSAFASSLPAHPARALDRTATRRPQGAWDSGPQRLAVAARAVRARLGGRRLVTGALALEARLLLAALHHGVKPRMNTRLAQLVTSAGQVTGAILSGDAGPFEVRSRLGVVVTDPGPDHAPGQPGENILTMRRIGAIAGEDDRVWWSPVLPGGASDSGGPTVPVGAALHKPHVLLVDAGGRRFVNEAAPAIEIGRAALSAIGSQGPQAASPAVWAVLDARHRARYALGDVAPGRRLGERERDGAVLREASLDALARRAGIDPGGLESTVNRWNVLSRRGKDEDFGKGATAWNRLGGDDRHAPNPCMGSLRDAPFFAVPVTFQPFASWGGVATDEDAAVLREGGKPIAGLFAAGECTDPLTTTHQAGPGQMTATGAVFALRAVRRLAS